MDVNATEGSDVVFNCKAHAKPKAIVEWMRNGEILDRKLILVILQYDRYLCRVFTQLRAATFVGVNRLKCP